MGETDKEPTASIFERVKELLPENSDTLTALDTKTAATEQTPTQWSIGEAPIKTPQNTPGYDAFKQMYDEGNQAALINIDQTPENLQAATKLLLRSPEFKEYIGQYALSNDTARNLQTLQQAILSTKKADTEITETKYTGSVDSDFFTGGETYFLDQILAGLENSKAVDTFFSQLRDNINTEVLQKIETEDKKNKIEPQETSKLNPTENNQAETKEDAFSKTKKLFNEREGELIEDLTSEEAWNEMRRILSSPEYQKAQTEEIGYDSTKGHPDPEIREYEAQMNEYRKQLPYPEINKPEKPKNYEERRNQPKIDYDRRRKEGLSFEEAIEAGYRQFEPKTSQQEQQTTEQQLLKTSSIKPVSTDNTSAELNIQQQNKTEQTTTLSNFQPQQEQPILETTSELPTGERLAQVEVAQDGTSEEILANTEKTNTTLQGLTQMIAALIQVTANQSGQTASMPVPVPTNNQSSSVQPGTPDAVLAAGQSMIPFIRSKFVYTI